MQDSMLTQVIKGIMTLPPTDIARLREILEVPDEAERKERAARELAREISLRDGAADWKWLKEHQDEYAGQWVALKDGQLISHGPELKTVRAAALAAGHADALFVQAERSDAPPFIF
jgi:hypothetical protein